MQPVFVRYSAGREIPYQIKTSIIDDNGRRKVRKEALYEAGKAHVEGIYKNALLLQNYRDILNIPPFSYTEGVFEAEFVEGRSLDELLTDELEAGRFEALSQICGRYKAILNRFPQVTAAPSASPLFTEIFGQYPGECLCMEIGQFDLLMENVIQTKDNQLFSLDYEWVIHAPVPVDFIAYRAARIFYNNHANSITTLTLDMMYEALDVKDEKHVFEEMEKHFSDRIHGEKFFEDQRKYYCEAPSVAELVLERPIKETTTLFYSDDGDFSAQKSLVYARQTARNWKIDYLFREPASVSSFRWDPTETGVVLVSNCQAVAEDTNGNLFYITEFRTNALPLEGKWCFTSDDPMIFFDLHECHLVTRVSITAEVERIAYSALSRRVLNPLQAERNHRESAITELTAQKKELTNTCNDLTVKNSELTQTCDELAAQKTELIGTLSNITAQKNELAKTLRDKEMSLACANYRISKTALAHRRIRNPIKRTARFLLKPFLGILKPLSHPKEMPYQFAGSIVQSPDGLWIAQDADPQILVMRPFKKGLYLFRWAGSAGKDCILKMFMDYGDGFTETNSVNIGMLTQGFALHEKVTQLKRNARMLRFDPGEDPNTFAIAEFSYVYLSPQTAVRMGLALIAGQQGRGKMKVLLHMAKLVLTGKKSEASRVFAHTLSSFGEGNKQILDDQAAYRQYIQTVESEQEDPDRQILQAAEFADKPLISVIVPVYNTDRGMLTDMIESVIHQTYGNWELCLADGCSTQPHVSEVLKQYAAGDPRIRIVLLPSNLGISGNTNAALALASGEYTALLDHDDLLPRWALFEVAKAINENGHPDVLYSDEDKITSDGSERFCPHFKPDWSPDYLRSINYITHLFIAKTSIIHEVGNFLPEYDGAQDHDLILRTTEKAGQIVHIPRILYHWRSHAQSTAQSPGNKSYTQDAGVRAIQAHISRIGLPGTVSWNMEKGVYQVRYDLIDTPLISIVIPSCDHSEDLSRCIDSIVSKSTYGNYEILVVENNSKKDETFSYYKRLEAAQPRVRIITWDGPFNFSAINNYAVKSASGSFVLFLNNDTEVKTLDWMEQMLSFAQRKDTGCVGVKLYYPDGTIQHAGVVLGFQGVAAHSFCRFEGNSTGYMGRAVGAQNVSAVTAACMMLRKSIFDEVGGYDETLAIAFNDIDLCMKVRDAGYKNIFNPAAELIHHESKSRGFEDTPEKQERFRKEILVFRKKWGKELDAGDPYYNPHFDLEYMPFRVSGR